jgi:hypothetical protein
MNLTIFETNNYLTDVSSTTYTSYNEPAINKLSGHDDLKCLLTQYGSKQVDNGLFRIHSLGSSFFWTNISTSYFPKYVNNVYCFGYDWMGRQFGILLETMDVIFMFDPATGQTMELSQSLEGFFNEDLVEFKDETFGTEYFGSLNYLIGKGLDSKKCIGFAKPLLLGGEDSLSNYELTDMEMYWELNYQIFCQINDLPNGTLINNITIS